MFGAHGVIVPKHHQVGLTDAAARAAMGAVEYLSVARETNLVNALEIVKKSGIWVLRWGRGRRRSGVGRGPDRPALPGPR